MPIPALPTNLPLTNSSRARVLLLGTFHFGDLGLDAYKPEHHVDVSSPAFQAEVDEVVARLTSFRPTKIAVERMPARQGELDDEYGRYLAALRDGQLELPASEVYQLGFRVAASAGNERLYAIDAQGRWSEQTWSELSEHAPRLGQETELDSHWNRVFAELYSHDDVLKTRTGLRDYLLYINSEERIRLGHGHYLVGPAKVGRGDEYWGADHLAGWWYSRNLRIFSNIQRLTESPDDRILVVIGAGHLPVLRHCLQCSPEHSLIEVSELLGDKSEP